MHTSEGRPRGETLGWESKDCEYPSLVLIFCFLDLSWGVYTLCFTYM